MKVAVFFSLHSIRIIGFQPDATVSLRKSLVITLRVFENQVYFYSLNGYSVCTSLILFQFSPRVPTKRVSLGLFSK